MNELRDAHTKRMETIAFEWLRNSDNPETKSLRDFTTKMIIGRDAEIERLRKIIVELECDCGPLATDMSLHDSFCRARISIEGATQKDEVDPDIKVTPKAAYNLAMHFGERIPELEPLIKKDPVWAYHYAHDVIKGRWPEAEETIKKDPVWAYHYAHDVIKGRWPEAEDVIKKDSKRAYWYALYVIKGRWPEAEETIKKDPVWAYHYAHDVIKGRWPEAEETIKKDPVWAYHYAHDVIKGRWPEAEETILNSEFAGEVDC